MKLPSGLGHLTYCTNIHAGEPFDEVMDSLATYLPGIRTRVCDGGQLGVGLRLGAQATQALQQPSEMARLQEFLTAGDHYVFTLNGFPYGPFHGQPVKDGAYKPDWADPLRLSYTNDLADILAQLLPNGQVGSISTVPCTFKPWADGQLDHITRNLVAHVAHLVGIERQTGKVIALALEPEPFCFLETIDETVAYFNDYLFAPAACDQLARACGLNRRDAERALRRHLGVCYDVCHAAVEFEDPAASIGLLRSEGISIGKLQLSSALRLAALDAAGLEHIESFNEPVYLHQVVQQHKGRLTRFADIPDAVAQASDAMGAEWRVHFHVPVFLNELTRFGSTQAFLAEVLDLHRREPISNHLEVETYTWDVLPPELRSVALDEAIARELNWVLGELNVSTDELAI